MKPLGLVARLLRGDRACDDASAVARGDRVLADDRRRRLLAAADARRRDDAHVGAEQRRQARQQVLRAGHLARQAVADAHRQRRRRGLAFLDDVEVVIEGRDLVHLGLREPHLLRPARRGARLTGGRSGPGSCAGARSAGRAGAARRRAAARTSAQRRGSTRRPRGASRLRWRVEPSGDDRDDGTVHASAARHATCHAASHSRPAPRAHWYLAPSTATGISVEYA